MLVCIVVPEKVPGKSVPKKIKKNINFGAYSTF